MLQRFSSLPTRLRRLTARTLLLASGPLAAWAGTLHAEAPSPVRSVTDVRPRIPDELGRPFSRETQSHRGWEIREPQFTIFASTSQHDARWAATHVQAAWSEAARLADQWGTTHRHSDFGLSALQVVIDDDPIRARDAPPTTLSVVGIQTQVSIRVAPGQSPLAEQVVRLREGAAFAMLHTAGLDAAVPPWVIGGLAAYAARQGIDEATLAAAAQNVGAIPLGGQAWRQPRAASDRLENFPLDEQDAAERIDFLLTGNDAQHAPALLAAVAAATKAAADAAAGGRGNEIAIGQAWEPPAGATAFDRLMAGLQPQYEAWRRDPLAGQPLFEPAPDAPIEMVALQREMVVVLKLARRFGAAKRGRVQSKIVAFDREQGEGVPTPRAASSVLSMPELAARLTDPQQPVWGTIAVDGGLLLSTDRDRVEQLLGMSQQRYRIERDGQRDYLVRRLADGRILRGWLEDNPENPGRPRARFEVVTRRASEETETTKHTKDTN